MQDTVEVKVADGIKSPTVIQKDLMSVPQSTDKKPLIDND